MIKMCLRDALHSTQTIEERNLEAYDRERAIEETIASADEARSLLHEIEDVVGHAVDVINNAEGVEGDEVFSSILDHLHASVNSIDTLDGRLNKVLDEVESA